MHSETQKTLVSRLTHLFTAGHPKHVEAEALRLIAEHDSGSASRAECAELMGSKLRDSLIDICAMQSRNFGYGMKTHIELIDLVTDARALPAQTPADMGAELARLREIEKTTHEGALAAVGELIALRARVAELQRECDRLAKREAEMTFDLDSENARIAALVAAIEGSLEEITEEINPSNYNHDVVCKIAREMDACLSGLQKALDAAKPGATPHPDSVRLDWLERSPLLKEVRHALDQDYENGPSIRASIDAAMKEGAK